MKTRKIEMKNEVNRALRAKKRFLMLAGALLCMLFVSESAWAGSSYYANLTATVNPDHSGTVYVAEGEDQPDDPSSHLEESTAEHDGSSDTHTPFTLYAQHNRGYVWTSWSEPIGQGEPKFSDGFSSTDNPTQVEVKCHPDKDGHYYATIQANFIENPVPSWLVKFLPSENGTYSVTGPTGYDSPIELSETTTHDTWNNDAIALEATPEEGYSFYRYYGLNAEGRKIGIGEIGVANQTIYVPVGVVAIGAEFAVSWNVIYKPAESGGSYTASQSGTACTIDGTTEHTTYATDNITFSAAPASGYAFYRYVGTNPDGNKVTIGTIGLADQTVHLIPGITNICAEFTDKPFLAANNVFDDLAGAIQATRQNNGSFSGIILLLQNYTVPAGYYTIPAGVTLLIPRSASQITPTIIVERNPSSSDAESASTPTVYRTLTLSSGVSLDVFGDIEVGGKQNSYRMNDVGTGRPIGPGCGLLSMNGNSSITLESGSNLRAWGFVTGSGKIDARRGARVDEMFQIMDFKGGSATTSSSFPNNKVFPLNQYFIQNVEVRTTYHPGAALFTSSGAIGVDMDNIKVIGVEGDEASLFLMDNEDDSEDTWVCKWYDATTDQQVYEVNNSAKLGNLIIVINYWGKYTFDSKDYVLPITNNMKIHLLEGKLNVTQNTMLMPGAEIEIDKQATVIIDPNMSLYLIDKAQWGKYVYSNVYARRVKYRPGGVPEVRDISSAEALGNAKMNVHGTFDVQGYLFTTEGGASIYSNDADAGTIMYTNVAPSVDGNLTLNTSQDGTTPKFTTFSTPSAKLLNADGEYAATAGTPAGQSYCYMNGKWTYMTIDPTNECFVKDNYNNYYAKPGAYVQLANGKTENADHTYSDANGQGRLYILMDECQWWEVELDNNLYKGITRDANDVASPNGKYYEYNNTTHKWEEKRYTITWKDWDGSVITTYQLTYGVTPKYNSANPTRPADVDYTYNFTGWSPAFAPVTGDQIYTATYSKEQIKYTIIFKFVDDYSGGAEIDRQQLARDEMPVIPTVTRAGYYLKWTPAVAAVTGNATYEADWMKELPDNYTITWKNYDGTTLKTTEPVRDATAEIVLADAPTATKPSTAEYRYEFAGWQPAVTAATADASYVAQFNEIAQTYAIRFYKEDGTTQIGETQELALGADPEVPEYAKEDPEAGRTYKLKWINKATSASVGVSVPSVSGAVDYKADFDVTVNRYTITLNSKDENGVLVAGCSFSGAGTYDYDTEVSIVANPNGGYEFVKWFDDNSTELERNITVSSNATYTAIVRKLPSITVNTDEARTLTQQTTVDEFIIKADDSGSGQVTGANYINIATGGHAYFDLTLKTQRRHWKAFTVPFEIDLKQYPILADGVSMPLGKQYDIVWYDGAERAANGKTPDCWKYVEDQADWILTPGVAYMIVFGRDVNTVRFTKKDGASVAYSGTVSVAENHTDRAGGTDGGWNGIGNPATYHALLSAGVTTCQVHNGEEIGSDGYIPCDMGKFIVGKAVFVQVAAEQTVVVNKADSDDPMIAPKPQSAPRRAKANATGKNRFDVQIAPADGQMADRMFLHADEDKEDKYVILQDLAKAGLSTKRAQMWVERYDTKLCKNTALLFNGVAEFPLGIFAPQAGEYEISVAESPDEESTLYLTLDGVPVWNLSYGPYTAKLEKGTTARYGLKWVRNYIPAISTSVDNTQVDNQPTAQKILLNDKVYILRGENVYSADGQLVK